MRSVYRRVMFLSAFIGTAVMTLLTVISLTIYLDSSMKLLQEREERFLSVYAAKVISEMTEIGRDLSAFAQSDAVQQALKAPMDLSADAQLLRKISLTRSAENALAHNDAITDVYLFTVYSEPMNLFRGPVSDFRAEALDRMKLFYNTPFFAEDGSFIVNAAAFSTDPECNNSGLLCLYRVMENGTKKNLGYLMLYLDKESIFGSLNTGDGDQQHIQRMIYSRTEGGIYSAPGGEAIPFPADRIDPDAQEGFFTTGSFLSSTRGVFVRFNSMDWYAVTLTPYTVLSDEVRIILLAMVILLFLLIVLFSLMSRSVAHSVSIPVNQVLHSLRDIQQENLALGAHDDHQDELAEVNNLLNDTKALLAQLITRIRETEKQKYELSLQVLQAQINPHFLVNTLNSIIWLSSLQGADNIRRLTSSLSAIVIPCMRNQSGIAPIRDELALLRDYETIMDFQYMSQFRIRYDIDPAVEEYLAPVLFLQPLVENCIIHGRDSGMPMLTIDIRAKKEDEQIVLSISDDGKGITEEKIRQIDAQRTSNRKQVQTFTSIGISNIRERMRLLYGEGASSLVIRRKEEGGTEVSIRIPLLRKEGLQ